MSDHEGHRDQPSLPIEETVRDVALTYMADKIGAGKGETSQERDARWDNAAQRNPQYSEKILLLKVVLFHADAARKHNARGVFALIEGAFQVSDPRAEMFLADLILGRFSTWDGNLTRAGDRGGFAMFDEAVRIREEARSLPEMDVPERFAQFSIRDGIKAVLEGAITVHPPLVP
ncbi:MAG: hypothetical protein HYV40_02150 [Candidatus Levybacteria bacterium]|nr:hypothetical protein [Candidatus Levybacteria bacterium]